MLCKLHYDVNHFNFLLEVMKCAGHSNCRILETNITLLTNKTNKVRRFCNAGKPQFHLTLHAYCTFIHIGHVFPFFVHRSYISFVEASDHLVTNYSVEL